MLSINKCCCLRLLIVLNVLFIFISASLHSLHSIQNNVYTSRAEVMAVADPAAHQPTSPPAHRPQLTPTPTPTSMPMLMAGSAIARQHFMHCAPPVGQVQALGQQVVRENLKLPQPASISAVNPHTLTHTHTYILLQPLYSLLYLRNTRKTAFVYLSKTKCISRHPASAGLAWAGLVCIFS